MRAASASCTARGQQSAPVAAEALSNIDDRIRRRTRKTLIEELLRRGGRHAFWDEATGRQRSV